MEEKEEKTMKRAYISMKAMQKFLAIEEELKKRQLSEFTFSQFLDLALERLPESFGSDIIESMTPVDYRISQLLKDEEFKQRVLRMGELDTKKKRKDPPAESTP